ncbi:iron complex outermembrane recepter protein [Sphingomonas gellani]|uniref:Iron complex outermembrane recepter protein n=1 Tax=Sphingomonas gellani TaxID=1166340 RepID=A0A1H8ILN2_9SPHN|nr:TonB-dependent siderophore receptor [Sphingomonas gellani]SEN68936.1 iron complex outermembrane recepter protein [Sphingomonas gellani]
MRTMVNMLLVTAAAWPMATMAQVPAHAAAQRETEEAAEPSVAHGDIVVTATGRSTASSSTKTDTPIIESPQTISVISRDEIDLRASPTIADALSYTAGVQAEAFGLDSRVDEVSVRGFGAGGFSSNNNFVDGLRLPTGGQWTRPGFDTFALQQIEVLKGPSGALYGQSAPGGIVNIVSKRPSFTPHGEVLLQGAGFTDLEKWTYQGGADVTGPLTDTLAARVVGLARYGETQIDGVKIARQYISPSVTWHPGANTTWTLLGQYQRDEGGATFQFLPRIGTLVPANGGYIDKNDNLGEADWNTFNRNQYLGASFFEQKFGDGRFALRNNTRYTHLDTLYRVVVLAGDTLTTCPATLRGCIPNQTINRRAVQGVGESDGWATDTQLEARVATGPVEHVLLGGFDYFHTEWEHYRDLVNSARVLPVLDVLNPVSRGAAGYATSLTPQIYTETVSSQKGSYLQDQLSWGNLRVTVGGRYDWAKDNTYNPVNRRRFINNNEKFTWRAGAVYLHPSGLAPYVSYATSFLPQVTDPSTSLNGVAFAPTTGQQWEAGLRYQGGRGIYVTLGGYQITQQNIVTPDPAGTLCGTTTCQVQTGEGRIRGLELEAKANLPWGMAVIAAGSRQWSEVTESNTTYTVPGVTGTLRQQGNDLPQVPSWLASLFLDERIRSGALAGVGFGGGVRYTGKSWGDTNNTLRIPDYTLFDLFVRYDLGVADPALEGLTLSINGRNIADKRFVATCTGTAACYYGQGRSLIARLQYRW